VIDHSPRPINLHVLDAQGNKGGWRFGRPILWVLRMGRAICMASGFRYQLHSTGDRLAKFETGPGRRWWETTHPRPLCPTCFCDHNPAWAMSIAWPWWQDHRFAREVFWRRRYRTVRGAKEGKQVRQGAPGLWSPKMDLFWARRSFNVPKRERCVDTANEISISVQ
jgi:hypothetical protein